MAVHMKDYSVTYLKHTQKDIWSVQSKTLRFSTNLMALGHTGFCRLAVDKIDRIQIQLKNAHFEWHFKHRE